MRHLIGWCWYIVVILVKKKRCLVQFGTALTPKEKQLKGELKSTFNNDMFSKYIYFGFVRYTFGVVSMSPRLLFRTTYL